MKVHFDYQNFDVTRPVVTTGVFDGVHLGHKEIIHRLNKAAGSLHGESVVVTFWPHPRMVLKQDTSIKLINTLEEKLSLMEKYGVQHVVIIPFTEEFSRTTSREFIENIIVGGLHVHHFIIGYNHHFGKGREGNFDAMVEFSGKHNFTLERLDVQTIENHKVSSSNIRKALHSGDIDNANNYLGYNYMITGRVVEGNKIGRTIDFPTANVVANNEFKLIPKEGVYAVEVAVENQKYPGMLNIGYRPTINSQTDSLTIEVHLIGFSGDLYNREITLFFRKRLRDEVKFSGLEHLREQLNADRNEVIKLLGGL